MKKKRTNEKKNWTIYLPILSMIFVAILFMYSNSYTEKWNFDWKGIRSEIKDSIELFDQYGVITFDKKNMSGKKNQQWYRQEWITKNANTSELFKLTNYPSGIVKGIAYKGLLLNPNVDKYPIIKKTLNDTLTFVHYQSGCIGSGCMLSDYVINFITNINSKRPPIQNSIEINLTEEEKSEIITLFKKRKEKEKYYKKEYFKKLH